MVPVIAATTGCAFTVKEIETESVQPFAFVTIYRIVSVPTAIAVTEPFASIIAIAVLVLSHVPPTVVSVNTVDLPEHKILSPLIAPITGKALTEIANLAESPQPPGIVILYHIVSVPLEIPVTNQV